MRKGLKKLSPALACITSPNAPPMSAQEPWSGDSWYERDGRWSQSHHQRRGEWIHHSPSSSDWRDDWQGSWQTSHSQSRSRSRSQPRSAQQSWTPPRSQSISISPSRWNGGAWWSPGPPPFSPSGHRQPPRYSQARQDWKDSLEGRVHKCRQQEEHKQPSWSGRLHAART